MEIDPLAFSFLHVADCHLGSPLAGLAARDGALAETFDRAVWRAFESIIELALSEAVDFIVIAGDVFDGAWRDWSTGQAFVRQLGRVTQAGIRVVMIRGNHDAASVISGRLPLPDGAVWLSADAPETIDWPDLAVAVHGMSFKVPAVTESLVGRYPPPIPGRFNIGVLHTALDGRPGIDRYAPASLADLKGRGYDYWALGHVHTREVVHPHAPTVVFPGNIQGRSIRETGEKSVTLVTVDGGAVSLRHVPVDHARFASLEVDVGGADTLEIVETRVRAAVADTLAEAEGRSLAVRIRLVGVTPLADTLAAGRESLRQELQAALAALPGSVAIEKVETAVRADSGHHAGLPGIDLEEVLSCVAMADAIRQGLADDLSTIVAKGRMPHAARAALDDDDDAILAAARAMILARLAETA
jgi:DNA repair exonuclease SbcCD nuclease subunit